MTTVLQLNTSIHSDASASSQLADELIADLKPARIIRRDLASDPVPHLDAEKFAAFLTAPDQRNPRQQELADESGRLVAELQEADVLVIGLPMYNFGVPSMLKAWFDHIARAGITFRYTETGPVGLLTGKKAYVVATRGGRYAGTDADLQSSYVRNFLGFLGITEVEFIYAEGLSMGADVRKASLAGARATLHNLQTPARLAA